MRSIANESRSPVKFCLLHPAFSFDKFRKCGAGKVEEKNLAFALNMGIKSKTILIVALVLILVVIVAFKLDFSGEKDMVWGVYFSKAHSEYLGLKWQETYQALLDELGVRYLRLSAYWNEIEKEKGKYDFSSLDWMMDEAAKRGAKVILGSGRRLPRWPECHFPEWAKNLEQKEFKNALLKFHDKVIERYKNHPALEMWQVENEPFVGFFGCPASDESLVKKEIEAVQQIDPNHQIFITDSGELSFWLKTASLGDFFGTTMYRVVWNKYIGYWNYNYLVPPVFYRFKAWLAGKPADKIFVSELQAEPWAEEGILELPLEEHKKSMSLKDFKANVNFAQRTGFRRAYLWGAEYWYWMKENGDSLLWEEANLMFGG